MFFLSRGRRRRAKRPRQTHSQQSTPRIVEFSRLISVICRCSVNPKTASCNAPQREVVALQDFALTDHPAFVGLISLVTGRTLQEDIATIGRRLLLQGQNILGLQVQEKNRPPHDSQTTAPP